MKCRVYETGFLAEYKYVVVFARHQGQWLFCQHKQRQTWEAPGGHVEAGETPLAAARRELFEETGALEFALEPLCDYWAVDEPHETRHITWANGMVFLAEIATLGTLPESEMARVQAFAGLPEALTYPDIARMLFPLAAAQVAARTEPKQPCPCPDAACPRHGDCPACQAHHAGKKKPPQCQRQGQG